MLNLQLFFLNKVVLLLYFKTKIYENVKQVVDVMLNVVW